MPRNFNTPLTIDGQGRISPHGDLSREKGETLTNLYVLVYQAGAAGTAGAACVDSLEAGDLTGNTWTTSARAAHQGQFLPGVATGMALLIGELNGTTTVFQWSRPIDLTP